VDVAIVRYKPNVGGLPLDAVLCLIANNGIVIG
jgi:hypothetical protein